MKWKVPLFKVNMPEDISVDGLLHSGFIGQGKYVDEFEEKFSEVFGLDKNRVVSLNSCTSAIGLALQMKGLTNADDVLTTPYTSIATNVHIKPANIVWYDVNKINGLASLGNIQKAVTDNTKVVILVHLSGTICEEIDDILQFCYEKDIEVIEDAAQSLGATHEDCFVRLKTRFTAFSFQAIKHMTTIDGGVLYCSNEEDARRAKKLRWFGIDRQVSFDVRSVDYDVKESGQKVHMTDINAYIGIKSLDTIKDKISAHKSNAEIYQKSVDSKYTICNRAESGSSFWTYPILVEKGRNELIESLRKEGIQSSVVHPRLDRMTCFRDSEKPLPGMDYIMDRIIHLPCGWWVKKEEVENICRIINNQGGH